MTDPAALEALLPGRLLVANPLLPDPNFDRTVVLLLAYSEEGALGVILNRPSDTGMGLPLDRWEGLAATPAVLFVGGPVQHQAVICLARTERSLASDPTMEGFKPLTPELGTLDLDQDPDRFAGALRQVRVFAGYAGWSPGQLEDEIAAGAWWVVDGDADDPFSVDPANLWKEVLRRQQAPLAYVAYYPDDPADN